MYKHKYTRYWHQFEREKRLIYLYAPRPQYNVPENVQKKAKKLKRKLQKKKEKSLHVSFQIIGMKLLAHGIKYNIWKRGKRKKVQHSSNSLQSTDQRFWISSTYWKW